ncbi:hypothetical protein GCM10009430_11950 [Aquimarina litoralis]|uniref:Uncharacterized protein n=2 Tax=Aquimarina litoralis TaxID=584605 RepID=A0ABP3TTT7_9FLAO
MQPNRSRILMKLILTCITFLLMLNLANAQITISWTVPGWSPDLLSQSSYNRINLINGTLNTQELARAGSTRIFTAPINDQLTELTSYNPAFGIQLVSLKNFISGSTFSSVTGYNSYGYIKKKYPLNPAFGNDTFKNGVIQLRFKRKLESESQKLSDYLNPINPIPEGERVLLILTALENVINLTLENETY